MGSAPGVANDGRELPTEVQKLIRSEQERAYRNLALKLGFGADPQKAYVRLSGTASSLVSHSPYEDPKRYQIMAVILRNVQKALAASGQRPLEPAPAFATLPSGNVNAQVVVEPKTDVPVIFFEQGLLQYLFDFCHLVGWAIPALSAQQLSDDAALTQMGHRYTMPFEASTAFVQALGSYAFEGSPMVKAARVPAPPHNMPVCIALLHLMERFVMVHELAHIDIGHLRSSMGRDQEYEADASSVVLVTYMTGQDGVGWGVGYWACELALLALNLLYRAIAVAEFGGKKLTWMDESHPEPLARQERLRQIWLEPSAPKMGVSAARELCGMSDALAQRLWEFASAALFLSHEQGARSSPMWRTLIDSTFAVKD